MPVGQDEKAAIIDDQLESVILMAQAPPNPTISCSAFQSRGGKTQKGYPLIRPEGNVPESFADLRQGTQVMMLLHQFLITLFFGWINGSDKDFFQIQNTYPRWSITMLLYNSSGDHCPVFLVISGFFLVFETE